MQQNRTKNCIFAIIAHQIIATENTLIRRDRQLPAILTAFFIVSNFKNNRIKANSSRPTGFLTLPFAYTDTLTYKPGEIIVVDGKL